MEDCDGFGGSGVDGVFVFVFTIIFAIIIGDIITVDGVITVDITNTLSFENNIIGVGVGFVLPITTTTLTPLLPQNRRNHRMRRDSLPSPLPPRRANPPRRRRGGTGRKAGESDFKDTSKGGVVRGVDGPDSIVLETFTGEEAGGRGGELEGRGQKWNYSII